MVMVRSVISPLQKKIESERERERERKKGLQETNQSIVLQHRRVSICYCHFIHDWSFVQGTLSSGGYELVHVHKRARDAFRKSYSSV